MGLLVGNTTVIEHAGTYIEYSRTYQHLKYSPEKISLGFVVPKDVSLSDGYLLARGVVNAQLGLRVEQPAKVSELCVLVFGQTLREMVGPSTPKKVGQRQSYNDVQEFDEDEEEYLGRAFNY